jgi:hypothetical protein
VIGRPSDSRRFSGKTKNWGWGDLVVERKGGTPAARGERLFTLPAALAGILEMRVPGPFILAPARAPAAALFSLRKCLRFSSIARV